MPWVAANLNTSSRQIAGASVPGLELDLSTPARAQALRRAGRSSDAWESDMARYRFLVRWHGFPDSPIATYAFDGIPADRADVAEARLWDTLDSRANPYAYEFCRMSEVSARDTPDERGYWETASPWGELHS